MSSWREETRSDLGEAAEILGALATSISGDPTRQQVRLVWSAYVKVEKSIAFIRFDFDEENPGRFIKLNAYSTPDERQSIGFALNYLRKGKQSFELGDFSLALKDLRESRNYLRALLREKRLSENRRARRP